MLVLFILPSGENGRNKMQQEAVKCTVILDFRLTKLYNIIMADK